MISFIWIIWVLQQLSTTVILLTVLIAILTSVYDETNKDYENLHYHLKSSSNIEVLETGCHLYGMWEFQSLYMMFYIQNGD